MKSIICFDLDGVICLTKKNHYHLSKPIKKNIKKINILFNKGFVIKIFTARFMGRSKESVVLARSWGFNMTQRQLKKWGVRYHKLIFGKPSYDLFIDDKCIFFKKNWIDEIDKKIKKI
jgi:hypothetical protein